jgi:hypothetical protein
MTRFILQTDLRPEHLEALLHSAIPHPRLFARLEKTACSGTISNGFFSIRLGTNYFFVGTPFDLLHVSGRILRQKNGEGMVVGFVHVHPFFYPIYLVVGVVCLYCGTQGYPASSAWFFCVATVSFFVIRFLAIRFWASFYVDRVLCFFDSVFTYRLYPYTKKEPAWYFAFRHRDA